MATVDTSGATLRDSKPVKYAAHPGWAADLEAARGLIPLDRTDILDAYAAPADDDAAAGVGAGGDTKSGGGDDPKEEARKKDLAALRDFLMAAGAALSGEGAAAMDPYGYEGLSNKYATNGPWVPPTRAAAVAFQSTVQIGGGNMPVCGSREADVGATSVGAAMYLRLMRWLFAMFALAFIVSLPSLIGYSSGARIPSSVADNMGFAHLSLGNAGPVSSVVAEAQAQRLQVASESGATNGTSNTSSATAADGTTIINGNAMYFGLEYNAWLADLPYVRLAGVMVSGGEFARLVSFLDVIGCAIILGGAIVLRRSIAAGVAAATAERVSAADYSILIKGLPPTTTAADLRTHFSTLFALDGTGYEAKRLAAKQKGTVRVAPAPPAPLPAGELPPPPPITLATVSARRPAGMDGGAAPAAATAPRIQPPLPAVAEAEEGGDGGEGGEGGAGAPGAGTGAADATPGDGAAPDAEAPAAAGDSTAPPPAADAAGESAAPPMSMAAVVSGASHMATALAQTPEGDARLVASMKERLAAGVVAAGDPHVAFADRLEVARRGVVTDVRHNGDAAYLGSWVADVSVVTSESAVVEGLLKARATIGQLRRARALYKMHSRGTPLPSGPNTKIRAQAKKAISAAKSNILLLMSKLSKETKEAPRCTGVAFVTFNNETSMEACLAAYSGSTTWYRRCFQNRLLRFPWRDASGKARAATLSVERAPEPGDVLYQNLGMSNTQRSVRVAITSGITGLLLCLGLVGMVLAQSYAKLLAQAVPDLSLCETEVPAAYLGSIEAVEAARAALAAGYGGMNLDTAGTPTLTSASGGEGLPYGAGSGDVVADVLPQLEPWRPVTTVERNVVDQACGVGYASLTYRYDFAGALGTSADSAYLPVVSAANTTAAATYDPSSRYYVGNMVGYGDITQACSLATARNEIATHGAGIVAAGGLLQAPSCPDPRRSLPGGSGQCQCLRATGTELCSTIGCFAGVPGVTVPDPILHPCRTYSSLTLVGCFCQSSLKHYSETLGGWGGFMKFMDVEKDMCTDFANMYLATQSLVIITAASATVVNVLLGIVLPRLVEWEKHASIAAKVRATVVKLAGAQMLNAVVTVVVVNARPPNGMATPGFFAAFGLFTGAYDDMTTKWYAAVGSSICLSTAINAVVEPLLGVVKFLVFRCLRWRKVGKPGRVANQDEYNSVWVGPEFDLATRFAPLMVSSMVALVYGGGMPLLYVIVAIAFGLRYAVDKLLLLRHFRRPPPVAPELFADIVSLLPIGVAIHLLVAAWAFAASGILPTTPLGAGASGDGEVDKTYSNWLASLRESDTVGLAPRPTRPEGLPHILAFVAGGGGGGGVAGGRPFTGGVRGVLSALPCGFSCCKPRALPTSTDGSDSGAGESKSGAAAAAAKPPIRGTTRRGLAAEKLLRTDTAKLTERDEGEAAMSWYATNNLLPTFSLSNALPAATLAIMNRLPPVARGAIVEGSALRALFAARQSHVDGRVQGHGKGLAAFTGEFSKVYDPALGVSLSRIMQADGWRLQALSGDTMGDMYTAQALVGWYAANAAGTPLHAMLPAGSLPALPASASEGGSSAPPPPPPAPAPPRSAGSSVTAGLDANLVAAAVQSIPPVALATAPDTLWLLRKLVAPSAAGAGDGAAAAAAASDGGAGEAPEAPASDAAAAATTPAAAAPESSTGTGTASLVSRITWQVIDDSGAQHSYDYRKSPKYRLAVLTAVEESSGDADDDPDDEEGGGADGKGGLASEAELMARARAENFGLGRASSRNDDALPGADGAAAPGVGASAVAGASSASTAAPV